MPTNSRLVRLIDLVPYISAHQGIAISDLAKKFQVSKAEIEKDLWLLYMCGLPEYTPLELMEFQFEDGFVTVRNAEELMTPRSLTQTEISTLVIGLELLQAQGSSLAEELKNKLSAQLELQIAYQATTQDLFAPIVTNAIQENLVLSIEYAGDTRKIIPIEQYIENNETYLRAFCLKVNSFRTFKFNRISNLIATEERSLIPNEVPTQNQVYGTKIKVHQNARLVLEKLGDVNEVEFYSKDWLISQVLALGGAVELLDSQLRDEIKDRIEATQKLYLG